MRVFSLSLACSLERVLGLYLLLVYTCAEGDMWGFSFSLARSPLARSRSLSFSCHMCTGGIWLHKWGLCAHPKSRLLPSLVAWVQSYKVFKVYKVYKVYTVYRVYKVCKDPFYQISYQESDAYIHTFDTNRVGRVPL